MKPSWAMIGQGQHRSPTGEALSTSFRGQSYFRWHWNTYKGIKKWPHDVCMHRRQHQTLWHQLNLHVSLPGMHQKYCIAPQKPALTVPAFALCSQAVDSNKKGKGRPGAESDSTRTVSLCEAHNLQPGLTAKRILISFCFHSV